MKLPVTVLAIAMMASLLPLPATAITNVESSASDSAPNSDFERSLDPPRADSLFSSASQVEVHGGGWGHGIGMSQWGAHAMATAGKSYEEILEHFYTGIQFGAVAPAGTIIQHADPIRIGVGPNRVSVSFIPQGGNGELCLDGVIDPDPGDDMTPPNCFIAHQGEQWFLYGPVATANPGDTCLITMKTSSTAPEQHVAESTLCKGTLTWANQPSVRMNFPGIGRTYARGSVSFDPILVAGQPNGLFHVNVVATMDEYLYGLGEVPSKWPMESMKAQAVAARSFALYRIWAIRNLPGGILGECACHLRATTVDQSYLGWHTGGMTEGTSSTGAAWRTAVQETSGKALWHSQHGNTRAAESYYFSSTGGATENNEDRWGGTPYPYLRSRNDPGATSWSKGFSFSGFASALGFSTVTWVDISERYVSGRPKSIQVQGTLNGALLTKHFSPAQFQSSLGLTSQFVKHVTGFVHPAGDRVVLHDPSNGQWWYRGENGSSNAIFYGVPGDRAVMGDWDCDGIATPGLYRQSTGYVYLRNSNTSGHADHRYYFGLTGDVPVVGDFNGDGCDTVSIYRPSQAKFYITNQLGSDGQGFVAEYSFFYGQVGDIPFVGDWNGNGIDTPGLRRGSDGFVYLRNTNSTGPADISYFYGLPGDIVFSGDWNGDGKDGLGIFRPANSTVYLRNQLTTGPADVWYQMGKSGFRPVAGFHD